MSEYKVQKLSPDQFDLLIPLMKDCFGMDVNTNYFRWKFLNNPAGSYIGFIAVEIATGEVAGYYGVIPEQYVFDGERKLIYQSGDTMTHSGHRRKGLFQKLAVHCYDYLKDNDKLFVIGFGGATSTPGLLKFGWRAVFDFRYLFLPKILCHANPLSKSFGNCEIVSDLQTIKSLIEEKPTAKIYSFRDIPHLIWRYGNPLHSQKIVAFSKDSVVEGYICYYVENNKIFLFDFVFSTKASRKSLIKYLKNRAIKEDLKGIVAFCQENGLSARQLKQSRFITNPFKRGPLNVKTPFMFYSDEETMNKFSTPDCWSIKSYDHDAL